MYNHKSFRQDDSRVMRYEVFRDADRLSFAEVVDLWQTDAGFREHFNSILADSPFAGFRWETPAVCSETVESPFEFVLVQADGFAKRKSDPVTYDGYFDDSGEGAGIVSFQNLSRTSTLIVPSPRTDSDVYGHLAAFVRGAPASQIDGLWELVGRQVSEKISAKPIWVSTAGGGVAWLHVRIDNRPKYYSHAEYRKL